MDLYLFKSLLIISVLVIVAVWFVYLLFFVRLKFFNRSMTKKLLIIIISYFAITTTNSIYDTYFFTFTKVEAQTHKAITEEILTLNKMYSAQAFQVKDKVIVELINHSSNTAVIVYEGKLNKNFYLQWNSDSQLFVFNENDLHHQTAYSVVLNVETDIYEENGFACQSLKLWQKFENCYMYKENPSSR